MSFKRDYLRRAQIKRVILDTSLLGSGTLGNLSTILASMGKFPTANNFSKDSFSPDFLEKWLSIAENCLLPNPFYHPHLLLNAMQLYGDRTHLFHQESDEGEIFMPLTGKFYLEAWRYPHCYLGTPLIVGKVDKLDKSNCLLHLAHSDLGLAYQVTSLLEHYSRPVIVNKKNISLDNYLQGFTNSARRKSYRKKLQPFRERGRFETYLFDSCHSPDLRFIDMFLELEDRGWKGRNKTSLLAKKEDELFFRRVFGFDDVSYLGSLQVMFNLLYLEDVLLAMRTSVVLKGDILSFKIAYNEDYAIYSPGLVMELLMIEHFLQKDFHLLDSCSLNKRPFTDIYRDKRHLLNVTYGCGGFAEGVAKLLGGVRLGVQRVKKLVNK